MCLIHDPFSEFAEAIRSLKLAADLRGTGFPSKVIEITSSVCGEGKTTIAKALAGLAGLTGAHVLLIDCDLRNPVLTRSLTPEATEGLLEAIARTREIEDVIWTDLDTGIDFLPAVNVADMAHTTQILRSEALKRVFDELKKKYEYIIVDLSPLMPVVDVRATTELINFYFFLIEWGRTRVDVVSDALSGAIEVYENTVGLVLNKVDSEVVGRYHGYQSSSYRRSYLKRKKGNALMPTYWRSIKPE